MIKINPKQLVKKATLRQLAEAYTVAACESKSVANYLAAKGIRTNVTEDTFMELARTNNMAITENQLADSIKKSLKDSLGEKANLGDFVKNIMHKTEEREKIKRTKGASNASQLFIILNSKTKRFFALVFRK